MKRRPVITGLGFISSIGNDRASVVESLRLGRHGLCTYDFCGNPDLPI